jgi:hypothetical protein
MLIPIVHADVFSFINDVKEVPESFENFISHASLIGPVMIQLQNHENIDIQLLQEQSNVFSGLFKRYPCYIQGSIPSEGDLATNLLDKGLLKLMFNYDDALPNPSKELIYFECSRLPRDRVGLNFFPLDKSDVVLLIAQYRSVVSTFSIRLEYYLCNVTRVIIMLATYNFNLA